MHKPNLAQPHVSEDDLVTLARIAGLALPPERLAALTAEFTGTLAIIADLSAVPHPVGDLAEALGAFDAAWPESHRSEGR